MSNWSNLPKNAINEPWTGDPKPLGFAPGIVNSQGLFWPIIVITLVIFLVWSEYGSQDCRFTEDGQQLCHNKAKVIEEDDTPQEIIDKIVYSVRKNHNLVNWRRALLFAMIATLLIFMYYYRCNIPNGFIFFMITLILMFVIYFPMTWFGAHWFRMNDDKIENALRSLRDRI